DWSRTDGFDERLQNAEDYDLALKFSAICEIMHIPDPLYQYRSHGENTSVVHRAEMCRNHLRAMTSALERLGLDNRWEAIPSTQEGKVDGGYRRRDRTQQMAVAKAAYEHLGDQFQIEALCELVDKVNTARYALGAWWRSQSSREYLKACDVSLLGSIVAATACQTQGNYAKGLALANSVLAQQPKDLYTQRLVETLKRADNQPGWSPEDEADLSTRFCDAPFERLETRRNGDVKFCCDSWLDIPIGNFNTDSAENIWNSEVAQKIRASVLAGRFSYCSRSRCPRILNRMLPLRDAVQSPELQAILKHQQVALRTKPRQLKLNHDASCNLSCPSCRNQVYKLSDVETQRLREITDAVVLPLLADARIVEITGSGDAFASKHFRYILQRINRNDYPHLRIDLFTNGLQFTEANWEKLSLKGLCRRAVISVDATEPESYRRLRRGGELSKLLGNFPFISRLRASGELERVVLVFIIQQDNYTQIPDMLRLTQQYGFDETFLKKLDPWGQTPAEYQAKNITAPTHPHHGDFLRILRDPILRQPVVNLGTLRPIYDCAVGETDKEFVK
ncbi:MAG: SPASM domain-containing protein, partial [Candidatus Parabeggiatoa sp.]|nr:SPASM domain-containing protein [Candidatus Parabeggiatoa sp.]